MTDIVGAVTLVNKSAFTVAILPATGEETLTFDNVTGGFEIQAGEKAQIVEYDGNYILTYGTAHAL